MMGDAPADVLTQDLYPVPNRVRQGAKLSSLEQYQTLYDESVTKPEEFWSQQAKRLQWDQPWDQVLDWDFHKAHIRWFEGGRLNVSVNCLDRHLKNRGDQVAILWEGDDPKDSKAITYQDLHQEVCRFANVLKDKGVKKGDRVCLYMPMVPELAVAMLACARMGAVHSVVFAGFSAQSLRDRINDSACKVLVTADGGLRGAKNIPLKDIADDALSGCASIKHCIVYRRTGQDITMKSGRDTWWHEDMADVSDQCDAESMDSEDPLFILYTSGSTGKPKGLLHTSAGYLLYASLTHETVFDLREDDIYWCTADIGWVTGHSYIVYGPLANGATTLMFESVPTYPDPSRFWQVVEKHKVNIFYTAPTAIRALAKEGEAWTQKHDLSSLRVLGTVGEPINPEAWRWYHKHVGRESCAIVDTWWQTETGGILITPLPGVTDTKPGSATRPFFGVRPTVVDAEGQVLSDSDVSGNLCIEFPWPGMARTIYGDHQRYIDTYFSTYPGKYFTGDGCRRDADGYYWITGRVDDVINVSGHRLGTAEIESALVLHEAVAEAAVVGMPHDIKGQGICAYVVLNESSGELANVSELLKQHVRQVIGAIAVPDLIHPTPGLPKTRSGKIMRRILRKLAAGESEQLGDLSTLADPKVVESLKKLASASS